MVAVTHYDFYHCVLMEYLADYILYIISFIDWEEVVKIISPF